MADPRAAAKVTRDDRRRAQTRERILEAGRSLVGDRGVAALHIQDITDRADIALGSFYSHFGSKELFVEELMERVISERLETMAAAVLDDGQADAAVVVAAATRHFVRLAYDEPEFASLLIQLSDADKVFARATYPYALRAVQQGLGQDRFEAGDVAVSANMVAGASLSLIRGILDGHHPDGAEVPHAELSLRVLGVPADEARAISRLSLEPLDLAPATTAQSTSKSTTSVTPTTST